MDMMIRKAYIKYIIGKFTKDVKFFKKKDDRLFLITIYQDIYSDVSGLDMLLLPLI